MAYEGFVNLDYAPTEKDLCVLFYIQPPEGKSVEWSAVRVAGESSVGTWVDVSTSVPRICETLSPRIYSIDEERKLVGVAYPIDLFELDNIPEVMSSIAGNVFGMKDVESLRLLDFTLPEEMIKKFSGPKYGITGVRKILRVKDRPLVGTIVKPKLGLNTKEHSTAAYNAWVGGCDIVKDDENLSSQKFNPFEKRVQATLRMLEKTEDETGEKKAYMPNVTAETDEMISRAEYVKENGGTYIMVDVLTVGFSALQTIRKKDFSLVIHAHRAMHAALTRSKTHGISMLALAKLYRLIGVDQLHIGTAVGKMEGPKQEVKSIRDEITLSGVPEDEGRFVQEWLKIKPTFPVCSGGLHPGHVPGILSFLGEDVIIQAGGGIHGHPEGTVAGAKAMRQAVEAALVGKPLGEYALKHKELALALEKFSSKKFSD